MRIEMAAGLAACALGLTGPALGQAHATDPRRARQTEPRGRLAGVNVILSMEAPPGFPQLVVSERDAAAVAVAVGKAMAAEAAAGLDPELPGKMVFHTATDCPLSAGQRRTRARWCSRQTASCPTPRTRGKETLATPPENGPKNNPEDRPNAERCLVGSGQPPLSSFALDSQIQIIAGRDQVMIHVEYGDDVRIVQLRAEHAPKTMWTRMGDSIGHWEGQTLVVETVGQPDADRDRIVPFLIVSGEATVIERFTPLPDRELLYQFTVIDPKVYAAPWMGEFSWFRTDKPMYEHACHEGNYSLPNVLAGARHEEAVARAKVATTAR